MILRIIEKRENPEKFVKYKIINQGSNVTNSEKKVDYEYYICDRCRKSFKATNRKWQEREGGILEYSISPYKRIKLAICNSCLNDALKELDEKYINGGKIDD